MMTDRLVLFILCRSLAFIDEQTDTLVKLYDYRLKLFLDSRGKKIFDHRRKSTGPTEQGILN